MTARLQSALKPVTLAVAAFILAGCSSLNPVPLKEQAVRDRAAIDRVNMFDQQEPIAGPITLEEAIARSLKYNLDLRLKKMEVAVNQQLHDVSKYDMLPNLVVGAGYSGRSWDRDYGVRSGRCDRAAVGAVLGGVAGGVIGAEASKPDQRTVAIVVGTVIGAAIGADIGRRIDQADRSCMGHALELAAPGQAVTWTNSSSGVSYQLTPADVATGSDGCRKFRLIATGAFGLSEGRTVACPSTDGTWSLSPEARLGRR
jgi:surface antigen